MTDKKLEWRNEDFVINNSLLVGLSEEGEEKIIKTDTLVIPEGVISIGLSAFEEAPIKKLVLPLSLKAIGSSAFSNSGLEEIIGGDNVEEIDFNTFENNNLRTVTNFLHLKRIKARAFARNKISNFYFGEELSEIEAFAFEDNRFEYVDFSRCNELKVKENAFKFNLIEHFLMGKITTLSSETFCFNKIESLRNSGFIDADITEPVSYSEKSRPFGSWEENDFVIRDNAFVDLTKEGYKKLLTANTLTFPSIEGVKRVDIKFSKMTFTYTFSFKSVYISEGIEEIGACTFPFREIEKVHLPKSLKVIEHEAFASTSIKSIKFPKNLEEIGYGAFASSKLQSVDLSETKVTKLQDKCFNNCRYLKEVKLPKGLDSIEDGVFQNTYSLREITIPESTTWIGHFAFSTSGLEKINFLNPENLETIQDAAFKGARLKFFPFEKVKSFEAIGFEAFERNDLEEVFIKSAGEVRGYAFKNNNIKKVNIINVENLSEEAFIGNNIEDFNIFDDTNIVSDDVFFD